MVRQAHSDTWIRIWYQPGQASDRLLGSYSIKDLWFAIPLSIAFYAGSIFISDIAWGEGITFRRVIIGLAASSAVALTSYLVISYLYYLAGKLLGGRGSLQRVRTGFLVTMILGLVIIPFDLLTRASSGWLETTLTVAYNLASLWLSVVNLKVFASSHLFSFWRALLALIAALLIIAVPAFVLLVPIAGWLGILG